MSDDVCDLLCLDLPRAEALRASRLNPAEVLDRAESAKAIGDTTRLALAAALREGGELCVCDLSWIVERPIKLVSHHLRILRQTGLVRSERDGRLVMYELTEKGRGFLGAIMTLEIAV